MAEGGHHPAFQAVVDDIERRYLDIIKNPAKHVHKDQQELELCCMVTVYGGVSSNLMEAHRILAPLPKYKFPKKREVERTTRPLTDEDRAVMRERLAGDMHWREAQRICEEIVLERGLTRNQVGTFRVYLRNQKLKVGKG